MIRHWSPAGSARRSRSTTTWPAHSLIVVAALAAPEILVEVEAYAAIPALR